MYVVNKQSDPFFFLGNKYPSFSFMLNRVINLLFFYEFQREFECKKRMPSKDVSQVVFKLPSSLCDLVLDKCQRTMEEAVQSSPYASQIKVLGEKLMFNGKEFFC